MQDFNPNVRNEEFFTIPVNGVVRAFRALTTTLSTGERIRGLDLSHWNADENIDFPALKANGIDFVILKVTEGTGFVDETFKSKYEAALAAGLIVMPYHFFRGNFGGAAQATHCIDTLRELGFLDAIEYKTIIWADVETSDGVSQSTRRNRLLAFLQTIESSGYQGGVYSSPYYWNMLIGSVSWINDYWQWDAHWSNVSYPTLPIGWTKEKCIVWQNGIHPTHWWVETVIGALGYVDHNYFFGTIERLKEILQFPTTTPPDCCEEVLEALELLEGEVNFLKLEIYNLQQSQTDLQNSLNKLESGQTGLVDITTDLDVRLKELEALEAEFRRILCGG